MLKKPTLKRTRAVAPEDDFSFKNPIYKKKYLKFTPPAKRLKFAEEGKFVTLNPKNIAALTQALNPASDSLRSVVSNTPDATRLAELKKSLDDPSKYSAQQRQALQQEYNKLLTKLYGEAKPSSLVQASEYTPSQLFDINRETLLKDLALRYEYIFRGMQIQNLTDNAIEGVAEMMLEFLRAETSVISTQSEYHGIVENMLDPETVLSGLEEVFPELKNDQAGFVEKVNEIIGDDEIDNAEELFDVFQRAENEIPVGAPGFFATPAPSAPASPLGGPEDVKEDPPPFVRTPSVPGTRTIFETTEEDDQKNKDEPLFKQNEAKIKLSDGSFVFIDIAEVYEDKTGDFTTLNIDGKTVVTFKMGTKQHTDLMYLLEETGYQTKVGRVDDPNQPFDEVKEEIYTFTNPELSAQRMTASQTLYFLNDKKFNRVRDKERYDYIITKKEGVNYNQYFVVLEDAAGTRMQNVMDPSMISLSWSRAIDAKTGKKTLIAISPNIYDSPTEDQQFEDLTLDAIKSDLNAARIPTDAKKPDDVKQPSGGVTGFAGDYTRFFEENSGGREFIPVSEDAYAVIREKFPELPVTPDRRLFIYRGDKNIIKVGEVRHTPEGKQKYGFRKIGDTQFRNMKQSIGKEMFEMTTGRGYVSHTSMFASPERRLQEQKWNEQESKNRAESVRKSMAETRRGPFWFLKKKGRGSRRIPLRNLRKIPTGPKKPFDFAGLVESGASSLFDNRKAIASGIATGAKGLAGVATVGSLLYLNEKKKQAGGMKRFANRSKVGKFRLDPRSIKRSLGFGSSQVDTSALNFTV